MPSRFKSRQQALQTLFLWDVRRQPIDDILRDFYGSLALEEGEPEPMKDHFGEELARGAIRQIGTLDDLIAHHSQHWRIERMPVVDRNILRVAIYEMKNLPTPSAVVIDQALELARRFAGEESIPFLNGVLDAVSRSLRG
ncbi:MAG: transcription antitermination factor NusB [Bryobacterales bacterium]|nr:transcription antitermination factor NusB [Bryobacterales bacterium]